MDEEKINIFAHLWIQERGEQLSRADREKERRKVERSREESSTGSK